MKRYVKTLAWTLLLLVGRATAGGGQESAEEVDRGPATKPDEPILLAPAAPDPERSARLVAWWRHFEVARPALALVAVRLRRERARWREGSAREGCRTARRTLREVDSAALRRVVDYRVTVEIGRALDEFDGAAIACLARRYFEFDYRLQVAEAALAAARERAAAQLARPTD